MDFDFGEIEVEDNIRWYREQYPSEGSRVLYLDADYIPYTVGFCSTDEEYQDYLDGKLDIKKKYDHACYLIQDAMSKAKCDAVKLFLTDSSTNFRAKLVDDYKAQRETEKPPFWVEVKEWIGSREAAVWSVRNEADDMISITANAMYRALDLDGIPRTEGMYRLWCPIVIGSKDKDVDQVFGQHVNLATGETYWVSELGELKPHFKDKEINEYAHLRTVDGVPVPDTYEGVTDTFTRGGRKGEPKTKRVCLGKKTVSRLDKLKGTGAKFFYAQVLMGDTVDNYFGLPNFGATGAYKLLDSETTIEGCLDKTVEKYKEVLGDGWRESFLLNARMAYMQKEFDELWRLPDGY